MHVKLFDIAKEELEKSNVHVIGGFISPTHRNYLKSKLKSQYIHETHRYDTEVHPF